MNKISQKKQTTNRLYLKIFPPVRMDNRRDLQEGPHNLKSLNKASIGGASQQALGCKSAYADFKECSTARSITQFLYSFWCGYQVSILRINFSGDCYANVSVSQRAKRPSIEREALT